MAERITSFWQLIYFAIGGVIGLVLNIFIERKILSGYFDIVNYIPFIIILSIGVYLFIRKMKGVEPCGIPFIIFLMSGGWSFAAKILLPHFS